MTTQNEIKDARVGYIVADLSTGNVIGQRNPNLQFHMASVIKLIILAAALAEVDKGRLSLTEVIPVAELHNDADHTLFRRDTSTMKMSELLCVMASQNNSVIADYFLGRLGIDTIQNFCVRSGLTNTTINSSILDINLMALGCRHNPRPRYWDELFEHVQTQPHKTPSDSTLRSICQYNTSTPRDISNLIRQAIGGTLLSKICQNFMISVLRKQVSAEYIPKYLSSVQRRNLGHSIGKVEIANRLRLINDVGFYVSPKISLSLVFLIDEISAPEAIQRWVALKTQFAIG